MNETTPPATPSTVTSFYKRYGLGLNIFVLVLVVVGLGYWLPSMNWRAAANGKTIAVRGEAVIAAAPDSYSFAPTFEDADIKKVTAEGNAAVAALKKLGVKDADIKTTVQAASAKPQPLATPTSASSVTPEMLRYPYSTASTYTINVTVASRELAQKVSDYLATTTATGQIAASSGFSKSTRNKLDLQARAEASKDAKAKAEALAGQLGVKVGKVVKISEDGGYGIYATEGKAMVDTAAPNAAAGPTIQPGTDEVTYTFSVEFELK